MNNKIQALREMRDKIDERFLCDVDSVLGVDGPIGDHHYKRLANQALIGGRLDKMIRDEITWDRQRRAQQTRRSER